MTPSLRDQLATAISLLSRSGLPVSLLLLLGCAAGGIAASASQFVYANFFRRNAVFITVVIGAAVVFSGGFNAAMDSLWEYNNKGVRMSEQRRHTPQLQPLPRSLSLLPPSLPLASLRSEAVQGRDPRPLPQPASQHRA